MGPRPTCAECGHVLAVGEWPYCPHGAVRELDARRWEPIVVWESNSEPGKFSYPGQASEACPEGYHSIELTNLRQADRFVKCANEVERSKAEHHREIRHALDDAGIHDRRREEDARGWAMLADGSKFYIRGNSRAEALQRAAREWADKRREQKRSRESREPNFHINILSFDGGHRNSYSGPETGWREKKK